MSALQELLKKADSYKQKISSARPLAKEELQSLDNYFCIGFTYSSNALEGNTLTVSETKILLEDGSTVLSRLIFPERSMFLLLRMRFPGS